MNSQQIIDAAMEMPPEWRVQVATRLYDSVFSDNQTLAANIQEAESRLNAYDRGEEGTVSAEDVFKKLLG